MVLKEVGKWIQKKSTQIPALYSILTSVTMGIANHFISCMILFVQSGNDRRPWFPLQWTFYVRIKAYQRLQGVSNPSSILKFTTGTYCLLLPSSCDNCGLWIWFSLSGNTGLRGGEVRPSHSYRGWYGHKVPHKITLDIFFLALASAWSSTNSTISYLAPNFYEEDIIFLWRSQVPWRNYFSPRGTQWGPKICVNTINPRWKAW